MVCSCNASQLPSVAPAPNVVPTSYSHHETFRYLGKQQTFKVPKGVTHVFVVVIGGGGAGSPVAHGGRLSAVIPVVSAEVLIVRVGGNGKTAVGGYNGGADGGSGIQGGSGYGGGGASDVREKGAALSNRILVAGGGGQGGWDYQSESGFFGVGGKGGGPRGGDGASGSYYGSKAGSNAGDGASGGTQKNGGMGGAGAQGQYCLATSGFNGVRGVGGHGATVASTTSEVYQCGGLGGGGGGGYYGGGGGGEGARIPSGGYGGGGGGGGGSSYAERTATDVHMWQGWNKNQYGLIVISW